MIVNICGIKHKIIECDDKLGTDINCGLIDYKKCEIYINKELTDEHKEETLCHEVLHGMLAHLGYMEQCNDEHFVQALSNAIYQSFDIKLKDDEKC